MLTVKRLYCVLSCVLYTCVLQFHLTDNAGRKANFDFNWAQEQVEFKVSVLDVVD